MGRDGKLAVVFFPYMAAMSDSMKSIYMAAKADPNCDAYWCPIPYFDLNKDKEPVRTHYDGMCYDSDFKVTNWEEYDVAKRHPDIIFSQYAYDQLSKATALPPEYYTSSLKGHTNLLVHVDYGLTWWIWRTPPQKPGDKEKWITAYWHADVVITHTREFANTLVWHMKSCWKTLCSMQEKKMLPDVIKCHMEEYRRFMDGNVMEGRFVPLGSAKFDAVVRDSKEHHELPKEWRKQIGNRKVLLYNSTYQGISDEEPECFLKDINDVIKRIASRDDIILWWRPHPLSEGVLWTMFPDLARGYRKIVEKFRKKKQGIYDDTHDLHRAIAWSDGCLTNESSLLWLYLATGKPFTIVNR